MTTPFSRLTSTGGSTNHTEATTPIAESAQSNATFATSTITSSLGFPSFGSSTLSSTVSPIIMVSFHSQLTWTGSPAFMTSSVVSLSIDYPILRTSSAGVSQQSKSSSVGNPTIEATFPITLSNTFGKTVASSSDASSATESSTDTLDLITYSSFPPVSTGEVSSITTDGHIETTGPDNRPTRVPVLKPHCFLWPPGLKFGVALFGLLLGIYLPRPPSLPGFTLHFPTITIGNNGDPTYASEAPSQLDPTPSKQGTSTPDPSSDSSSSPSSSSKEVSSFPSCTSTITASIYSELISYDVDQAGATTRTLTSSQCSATIGCNAQSRFVTSTVSSPGSCPSFGHIAFDFKVDEDDINENDVWPTTDEVLQGRSKQSTAFHLRNEDNPRISI
jgi:hypothetical protein